MLQERSWRVRDVHTVAATPWDYQIYIQDSFAEFSCAKPSCIRLQNAWISDRTLCYPWPVESLPWSSIQVRAASSQMRQGYFASVMWRQRHSA